MSALPSREPDPAAGPGSPRPPTKVPLADVQGMFAFYLRPRLEPPRPPGEDDDGGRDALPRPIPLPPADKRLYKWIKLFALYVVEVVCGDRPASQLVRWTTGDVGSELRYRASLTARAGAYQPGAGRNQPIRAKVKKWHAQELSDDIVEANATIEFGDGCRALALRFERKGDDWICTALNFGRYD